MGRQHDGRGRHEVRADAPLGLFFRRLGIGRSRNALTTVDGVNDIYPLSTAQEGMLYHYISEPESGVYIEQVHFFISGNVVPELISESWKNLVDAHPILRTAFLWDGLEQPLQVVQDQVEIPWLFEDMSGCEELERKEKWESLLERDRTQGLELAAAPLMRIRLLRFTDKAWRLLVTFHHILLDGWSFHALLHEFFELYEGKLLGRDIQLTPRLPFREFVAWHQSYNPPGEEQFWRANFEGFEGSRIQLEASSLGGGFQTGRWWLTDSQTEALTTLCRASRVTPNTVFQAAWALLLCAYTHSRDLAFGVTVSGRVPALPGAEAILGPLLNVLPFRASVPQQGTLIDWLRVLQERSLELQKYQLSSLPEVQRLIELPPETSLFESLLVYENYPASPFTSDQFEISGLDFLEKSHYPLACLVVPGSKLRFRLIADGALLGDSALQAMGSQLRNLLGQMCEGFHKDVSSYLLQNTSEDQNLVQLGSGIDLGEPIDVIELFEQQVREHPKAPALLSDDLSLSYQELDSRASRLAFTLKCSGLEAGGRAGILLERSPHFVIAILAILKLGASYIPLSLRRPPSNITEILERAEVTCLVSDARLVEGLELSGRPWVPVTSLAEQGVQSMPGDEAYVLFTSGSTGHSKGVIVSREGLAQSTAARRHYYGPGKERFLLLSSLAFDSSIAGLFGTLSQGGALVLPAQDIEQAPYLVLEKMAEYKVSATLCLPSLWSIILEEADPFQLAGLKVVVVAGEVCPTGLVEEHYGIVPDTTLFNEYGPTEAVVWASVFKVPEGWSGASVPIGGPIPGAVLEVRDPLGRRVPNGVVGELWIGGRSLATGYLGQEFEDSSFIHFEGRRYYKSGDLAWWDTTGNLGYAGRCDGQVKIRGYRIEPSAVESVLMEFPQVVEAAVTAYDGRLLAYVVGGVEKAELQTFAAQHLPDYALPSQIQLLADLPKTSTGKLDRRRLPKPTAPAIEFTWPRTDEEQILADIWSEVLDYSPVGIHDNFLELGGDSLLSIRVASKARTAGIELLPQDLLTYPTIALLSPQRASSHQKEFPEPVSGKKVPLTPIQHWFLSRPGAQPHHWNLSNWFRCSENIDLERLQTALGQLLHRHDIFWLTYQIGTNGWEQTIGNAPELTLEAWTCTEFTDASRADMESRLQSSFRLIENPLMRAALVTADSGQELLLICHHLIFDYVSWPLLTSELESLYRGVEQGPVPLPYRLWSEHNVSLSQESLVQEEVSYWLNQQSDWKIPVDNSCGSNTEADSATVTVKLKASKTHSDSLLIASVLLALQNRFDFSSFLVGLEGHGRGDSEVDVSATLGWFADFFPLHLNWSEGATEQQALEAVLEQVTEVPANGRNYGILRYLTLSKLPPVEPEIMFTNLGKLSKWEGSSLFQYAAGPSSVARHPNTARRFLLEIFSREVGEQIEVRWKYGKNVHRKDTIDELALSASQIYERLRKVYL